MVKKLFKHEFLAFVRIMSVVYMILLTVATASRIIQIFENDSIPYAIISTITGSAYFVSIFAALAFCGAFTLVRFYKNLFTHEGYLSFTLPVTTVQHIWVKALTALAFGAMTWVVVLVSGCIFAAGELLVEIGKAISYLWAELYEFAGFHAVAACLELAILLSVAALASILLYYTFIAIGQLSKKNRVLAAVGAYFVYYIITQVLSTIFTVVLAMLTETTSVIEALGLWILEHPGAAIHIGLWIGIVLSAAFGWLCFAITKSITTKKLNLE